MGHTIFPCYDRTHYGHILLHQSMSETTIFVQHPHHLSMYPPIGYRKLQRLFHFLSFLWIILHRRALPGKQLETNKEIGDAFELRGCV